jgi:hypothetical protein
MHTRPTTLAFALACLAAVAPAAAQSPTPVETARLPAESPTSASTLPATRQTGTASFDMDGTPVTVRSWEPDGGGGQGYRISFEALDSNGDGYISRAEAAAHENLAREFGGVDADADGRASRAELSGWTITD